MKRPGEYKPFTLEWYEELWEWAHTIRMRAQFNDNRPKLDRFNNICRWINNRIELIWSNKEID